MTAVEQTEELRLQPIGETGTDPVKLTADKPALIGRSQTATVCVVHPSVSRSHARIEHQGDGWFLTDLSSRHGTQVNGVQLEADVPAPIAMGDIVRVGPVVFRVEGGAPIARTFATTDGAPVAGTVVERVPSRELEAVARRRLDLLMDGAAEIHQARDEEGLARAIIDLVLDGSGYPRAAVLRHTGTLDEVEILASRDQLEEAEAPPFSFSRSLLREAAAGHVARMMEDAAPPPGQSIVSLGIQSALCAPIMLDGSVIGSIYLDSRHAERPGQPDAGGFCHAVARLAGLALASLKRTELEQRQGRLEKDLSAAREAQDFLLPEKKGIVGGLVYAMQSHPGRVVAGDLFDIFEIGPGRVGILFGDVCGQGMGASILMTAVISYLRASLTGTGQPDPVMAITSLNRFVNERSPVHMFVSLWVGVFDGKSGSLAYVDAGHGHWFTRAQGSDPTPAERPQAGLVGIDPDQKFTDRTIDLKSGDRIVFYSDGITEHRDPEGEEFGRDRLQSALMEPDGPSADVDAAMAALRVFIGPGPLADDTTVASIELE